MELSEEQRPCPQIPRQAVRLLWCWDEWLGVLSGICLYQGERYWFEAIDPLDDETGKCVFPRRMGLYRLLREELRVQEEIHQQFQRYVGMHTDYDENEQLHRPVRLSQEREREKYQEWKKYDAWLKQQPPFDYSQNEMVGWFEMDKSELCPEVSGLM